MSRRWKLSCSRRDAVRRSHGCWRLSDSARVLDNPGARSHVAFEEGACSVRSEYHRWQHSVRRLTVRSGADGIMMIPSLGSLLVEHAAPASCCSKAHSTSLGSYAGGLDCGHHNAHEVSIASCQLLLVVWQAFLRKSEAVTRNGRRRCQSKGCHRRHSAEEQHMEGCQAVSERRRQRNAGHLCHPASGHGESPSAARRYWIAGAPTPSPPPWLPVLPCPHRTCSDAFNAPPHSMTRVAVTPPPC